MCTAVGGTAVGILLLQMRRGDRRIWMLFVLSRHWHIGDMIVVVVRIVVMRRP